jgi:mono/diheme cytochrome c family protein/uncharacterized cupredoxin-like copper-binding protein
VSDERTGRELAPREPDRVPAPVERGVERFDAGQQAHTVGLTEERAAQVVRQSGNARNIAFLATLIVVLFVPIYWFYDIGVPAIANTSRLEAERERQYVTDVSRGYGVFLDNCATCHGDNGEGGIGPPLNDQAKLYNALDAKREPGKGHLNPDYLEAVLTEGGRYVCGDPKSVMPAWKEPKGPLTYRQVEELIAFLTAGSDVKYTFQPEHAEPGETLPPPVERAGWRDVDYKPAPDAPSPPACWRDPDGLQIGPNAAAGSAAPVENPGTADAPRVIEVKETATVTITDEADQPLTAIAVKAGEVVEFRVENTSGVLPHNFYIGTAEDLQATARDRLEGVSDFTEGTQTFRYEVPEEGPLQFACIVQGHYPTMHGDLQIQP